MKEYPVDLSEANPRYLSAVAAERDGVQQLREGVPVWTVTCLVKVPDEKPETVDVKVPNKASPSLQELDPVHFVGLVLRPWAMGERSGVALSARSVESVRSVKASA